MSVSLTYLLHSARTSKKWKTAGGKSDMLVNEIRENQKISDEIFSMTRKMAGFSYFGFYAVGLVILAFLTSKAYSISCYVCNSEFDPSCGDPFRPYTIGVLNCSLSIKPDHIAGQEAKLCRKIVQKIQGTERIYRSCGYIEDPLRDDKECIKRSGTHDVHVDYCSCTGDLCNKATSLSYNLYNILLIVIFGVCIGMNVSNTTKAFSPLRVL